jgi:hypothetical protein
MPRLGGKRVRRSKTTSTELEELAAANAERQARSACSIGQRRQFSSGMVKAAAAVLFIGGRQALRTARFRAFARCLEFF